MWRGQETDGGKFWLIMFLLSQGARIKEKLTELVSVLNEGLFRTRGSDIQLFISQEGLQRSLLLQVFGRLQKAFELVLPLGAVNFTQVIAVGPVVPEKPAAEPAGIFLSFLWLSLVQGPLVKCQGLFTLVLFSTHRAGMVELPALPCCVACKK